MVLHLECPFIHARKRIDDVRAEIGISVCCRVLSVTGTPLRPTDKITDPFQFYNIHMHGLSLYVSVSICLYLSASLSLSTSKYINKIQQVVKVVVRQILKKNPSVVLVIPGEQHSNLLYYQMQLN